MAQQSWTDPTYAVVFKPAHVDELQDAINAWENAYSIAPTVFTDDEPTTATRIDALLFTEMQDALDALYQLTDASDFTWTTAAGYQFGDTAGVDGGDPLVEEVRDNMNFMQDQKCYQCDLCDTETCTCDPACHSDGCDLCNAACYPKTCTCNPGCHSDGCDLCNAACYPKTCYCNPGCYGDVIQCPLCHNQCYRQSKQGCECEYTCYNDGCDLCNAACYTNVCNCNTGCYGDVCSQCNAQCYTNVCDCNTGCYGDVCSTCDGECHEEGCSQCHVANYRYPWV